MRWQSWAMPRSEAKDMVSGLFDEEHVRFAPTEDGLGLVVDQILGSVHL